MLRLISYFILINLITFIFRGIDKRKAILQKWRISEKTLLYLSAFGGRIGAIFAMGVRKHKTIKSKFLTRFYVIAGMWIVILIAGYTIFAIFGE